MFSKPMDSYKIFNPKEFFYNNIPCKECENEQTHYCAEDYMTENNFLLKPYNLTDIYFNKITIEKVLKKLDLTMTSGPEGVPSIVLNKCSESLSLPLFLLWTKSLNSGIFPKQLKDSFINPGLKSEDNIITQRVGDR